MLLAIYLILGYLAVPRTIWADRVIIEGFLSRRRLVLAILFGWALIPWWVIKIFCGSKG